MPSSFFLFALHDDPNVYKVMGEFGLTVALLGAFFESGSVDRARGLFWPACRYL